MNFLNTIFDCCFRNKEFKLLPNIDKELEEEKVKEKENLENTKEKEKSEATKEKDKEKNNSDNTKEKGYSTIIKDKDKEKNNTDNTKEKENLKTIKDKDKNTIIKDTPKDKKEITPIESSAKNFSSFNAILRCLSNVNKLNKYFFETFPKNPDFEEKIISYEYYKLIKDYESNNKNIPYSSLIKFKEKISEKYGFLSKKVETNSIDSFIFLLGEMHSELKDKREQIPKNPSYNQNYNEVDAFNEFSKEFKENQNSIICDLFPVVSEKIYQCNICQILDYDFLFAFYIEFQLEKVNNYRMRNNYNMTNNNMPDINLIECFEFCNNNIELSSGDDKRFCKVCNILSDYYSKDIFCSFPKNLIIYLNRGASDIYDYNVIFQEYLNLNSYVKDISSNTMQELFAFICGINKSPNEQHFVAYCKNQEDKRWYLYDGDLVSSCEKPWENHKGMVYILFYKSLL